MGGAGWGGGLLSPIVRPLTPPSPREERGEGARRIASKGTGGMIKNRITRRQLSLMLASAAAAGISSELQSAQAQAHYPSRPVRFILPFGAAGVADLTPRLARAQLPGQLVPR